MGSLKSPYMISYYSPIATTALNCLLFENTFHATDRQTVSQTNRRTASSRIGPGFGAGAWLLLRVAIILLRVGVHAIRPQRPATQAPWFRHKRSQLSRQSYSSATAVRIPRRSVKILRPPNDTVNLEMNVINAVHCWPVSHWLIAVTQRNRVRCLSLSVTDTKESP